MKMDDLISRQDAYDVLTDYYHHRTEIQHKGLKEALSRVPSAQPEIIYCRNCRYSKDSGDYQDSYFCYNSHHNQAYLVHSMEFCSYAERRTDE